MPRIVPSHPERGADTHVIGTYRTRPAQASAVQFDGGNLGEVRRLLPGSVTAERGMDAAHVIVREQGRLDRVLAPGMWISVRDGQVTTHSDQAFRLMFTVQPPP